MTLNVAPAQSRGGLTAQQWSGRWQTYAQLWYPMGAVYSNSSRDILTPLLSLSLQVVNLPFILYGSMPYHSSLRILLVAHLQ